MCRRITIGGWSTDRPARRFSAAPPFRLWFFPACRRQERVGRSTVRFFTSELGKAASSRRTPKRTKRLTPLSFGLGRHHRAGKQGWVLLRFGFSLANLAKRRRGAALQKRAKRLPRLSFGLVRDHRPALHHPFHVVQSARISALTREKV